jgi:nucleoside-diphosphate-sugar epimerase
LHALHVDDCGDAYVAIASHPRREDVEGQIFNVSAHRYETVNEVGNALASEYGIKSGLKYVKPNELRDGENPWPPFLIDYLRWADSSKLRKATGWTDRRPQFSEALHVYRIEYEAAKASQNFMVQANVNKISQVFSASSG